MAQVLLAMLAEEHSAGAVQARLAHVICRGPASGSVGGDRPRLPRAPDRHAYCHAHRGQTAAARYRAAHVEDIGCVGVEEEPPFEQAPGVVDRRAEGLEPRSAQACLMAEGRSGPLGCTLHADHDDAQHRRDLTVENPLVA